MALGLRDSRKCCLRSFFEEIQILQGLLSMPENSFAFLSAKRQIFGGRQIFFAWTAQSTFPPPLLL
jgi:hypothetical protein